VASSPSQTFEQALAIIAQDTDTFLEEALSLRGAAAPRLVEAMRYASLGAGKRLRPFFVVATSRLHDVDERSALRVGAALECVHCYSLVHDDLPAMDNDDLRRGKPTVHRAFDEATAILVGDSLQTLAFELLADPETHADAEVRVALIGALARAAGKNGMAGGQMLDLEAETHAVHELRDIMRLQALKTGALFGFACEAGAMLAKADPEPLRQYAEHVGLAFQIVDDILDVEASPETLGKATQKDHDKGKATFVDLLGLEEAKQRAVAHAEGAVAALKPYGRKASLLAEAARFIVSRRK
jgi:farnesyl diphosphate synthase